MKITLGEGLYNVYEFEETHNHILASGDMTQYLRSHKKVTEAQIAAAEVAKSVGISNKATVDLMAKQACGPGNLGFIREDMKNRLYTKRSYKQRKAAPEEY
jgi:zinc finger SWIM domain-containing protein 3